MDGLAFFGLLLPLLAGALLGPAWLQLQACGRGRIALGGLVGAALGLGLASIALPLVVVAFGKWPETFAYQDAICWGLILIVAVGAWVRWPLEQPEPDPAPPRDRYWFVALCGLLAAVALLAATMSLLYLIQAMPHGQWDAQAIWNYHARFFYRDQGEYWQNLFVQDDHHAEYPLLLPGSVARLWAYQHGESVLVPQLLGGLYFVATGGLLILTLAQTRSLALGLLAAAFWWGLSWVHATTAAQYADVPLAFWFLAAVSVPALANSRNRLAIGLVSGLCAGLAAWTKNEGLPFVAILGLVRLLDPVNRGWRSWVGYALGALGPVLLNLWWKSQSPFGNDLVGQASPWAKLFDPSRWADLFSAGSGLIVQSYGGALGALAMSVLALGIRAKPERKLFTPLLVCMALAGVYIVTLILTPHEVAWHTNTSCRRLALHLWPLLLLGLLQLVNPIGQAEPEPKSP